jgi:hypothetical protein
MFFFYVSLQLKIVCMKNNPRLPLFFHITRVLNGSELHSKQFEQFNIQEGFTFQHLPGNKGDKDQEPTEMELVSLILGFMAF